MQEPTVERVYRALSDPSRREILDRLRAGDLPATGIPLTKRISQSALSQHLRVLRLAGLIDVRKQGQKRLYSLNAVALMPVFDWIVHYEEFWNAKLQGLGRLLHKRHSDEEGER